MTSIEVGYRVGLKGTLNSVEASLCLDGYTQCCIKPPKVKGRNITSKCLPDTGAQLTVTGMKFMRSLRVTKSELIPLSHGVSAANNMGLGLLGGAFVTFKGKNQQGIVSETRQLCYVASNIEGVYLSKSACVELGLIHSKFPAIGAFGHQKTTDFIETNLDNKDYKVYKCSYNDYICTLYSPIPSKLPFPAVAANREKLKQWIIDRYSSSAFNQCEHQRLPLMKGSPQSNCTLMRMLDLLQFIR